ncbi:ornithine-acyl[acyl carrier protein] N-acyltransferase [Arboricoccus pini]|uniref:L-ornithine N(alpha)-acyltransferase n=1 Tax=Arboricoccus pini TaxID=1963835 RepID=A0A212Q5I9_9PROT|nr:GNAT family N-acyltransferase [Arboricoccus pini]SNB54608.1 ornithine-acyl[acyl carrier protein] N-acyltransferase [Arboricoccus pini]
MTTSTTNLEVRLAESASELRQAQALRYRVFFEEMGAVANATTAARRLDVDRFDELADHLVVLDHSSGRSTVIGCYRMLRRTVVGDVNEFYSAAEYDLSVLASRRREILELGRSCVDAAYRTGTVMQLLWRGIAEYLETHEIGLMIGCASLPGTDIARVAPQIRYLHEHHLAPLPLRPHAHSQCRVAHEPFAADNYLPDRAQRMLPPLLRGYLRVGAMIGEGAVLDQQFNTIDVCVILPTQQIDERYLRHYQPSLTATAAA